MEPRLRKIAFRAAHRGMKEMDLLLGGFADRHLASLNDVELDLFEKLLNAPDPDLYAWVTGMEQVPAEYASEVMRRLQEFNLEPSDYTSQA